MNNFDALTTTLNSFDAPMIANTIIDSLNNAIAAPITTPITNTDNGMILGYTINAEATPIIASCLLDIIANLISSLIDMGSERDAVNENETLYNAILSELNDWTR